MPEYKDQSRYLVNGTSAVREQHERPVEKAPVKKRQRRVLPRNAVNVLPIAYVMTVAIACVCILACSGIYIHSKTEVTALTKQISTLQSSLETVRQENQDLQNEITTSTSLDTIRKKATKDLGMVPADESQIVYFEGSDSEYVRQKEDIPNE